jgi:hypothetical protein
MARRIVLLAAFAAWFLVHVSGQPVLPASVSDFVVFPPQPVARAPWTIRFHYAPSSPGIQCSQLSGVVNHLFPDQLKACTPFWSASVPVLGTSKCLITILCGTGGDTVGGLQSLEAVVKRHWGSNTQDLERIAVANAPFTNNLVRPRRPFTAPKQLCSVPALLCVHTTTSSPLSPSFVCLYTASRHALTSCASHPLPPPLPLPHTHPPCDVLQCMLPSGPWLQSCTGCTYGCNRFRTASCQSCPCPTTEDPAARCPVTTNLNTQSCDAAVQPPMVLTYDVATLGFVRVCPP